MFTAVWLIGLLLLALWSATLWVAWWGWTQLGELPWSQALETARTAEFPPWLDIWFGGAWREWIQAIGPLLEGALRFLEGSAGWVQGLVPVLLWILWGLGTLAIVAFTVAAAGGVRWWRRRHHAPPAVR